MVIENTAFLSDLALYFPKITHKLYDRKEAWKSILESAVELTIKSGLIDEETMTAIHLVHL